MPATDNLDLGMAASAIDTCPSNWLSLQQDYDLDEDGTYANVEPANSCIFIHEYYRATRSVSTQHFVLPKQKPASILIIDCTVDNIWIESNEWQKSK